jgi:hypothetical protein
MTKFALKKIEAVKGKIDIYKLIINGNCEYDEFFDKLEKDNKETVIGSFYATLNAVANLIKLPFTRFRELKGRKKGDKIKDYEAKKDIYRLYLFKHSSGKIVAFGGIKDNQDKDIKRLRRLKLEFIKTYEI